MKMTTIPIKTARHTPMGRIERKAISWWRRFGYRCTPVGFREWNLVAVGSANVVLVHVGSRAPDSKERDRLKSFVVPENCEKLLFIWDKREKAFDIQDA